LPVVLNDPKQGSEPLRLGLAGGFVPADPDEADDRVAARVAELGFEGITAHFGRRGAPDELEPAALIRAREVFETRGVRVVHSWGFGANLVHPDPIVRGEQVGLVGGAFRVAAALGAEGVIGGAGSVDPRGGYTPHPGNHEATTRERLVSSLRAVAALGEQAGIPYVLEGHVLTALDTPERVRETIDAVGSPFVRANLDPVNFVGGVADLYDSTGLVERTFGALADVAVSGHVKDAYVEDAFVVHVSETVPGDGAFDVGSFVRGFAARLPGRFLFVEHLPAGLVALARRRVESLL
jgi:sugar phosphate isomerase/epimerase